MKMKKINFFISKENRKILISHYLAIFAVLKNVFISILALLVTNLRAQNMITLYILGVVISILLNMTVVVITIKKKSRASHLDYLMMSLAVSDIIRAGSGYPLEIYALMNSEVINDLACTIAGFSITFLALVSISHLLGMSIERCIIMVFPWKARQWFSNRWIALCIIIPSWVYGLLWAVFPLLGWSTYRREQGARHRCSINLVTPDNHARSYAISLLIACFIVPVSGIVVTSAFSLREMKKMTNQVGVLGIDQEQGSLRRKVEVKHTLMSFVLISVFLFTWTPYSICVFIISSNGKVGDTLLAASAIFAKSSTIYNPIIYFAFMKDFRKRFLMMLGLQQIPLDSKRKETSINTVSTITRAKKNDSAVDSEA